RAKVNAVEREMEAAKAVLERARRQFEVGQVNKDAVVDAEQKLLQLEAMREKLIRDVDYQKLSTDLKLKEVELAQRADLESRRAEIDRAKALETLGLSMREELFKELQKREAATRDVLAAES